MSDHFSGPSVMGDPAVDLPFSATSPDVVERQRHSWCG